MNRHMSRDISISLCLENVEFQLIDLYSDKIFDLLR